MTGHTQPPIELQSTADGVMLAVRAQPGARRNAIAGVHARALKVSVTAAAEKGKANEAIVELLAERLELARSQIAVVSGLTSRQKKLLIRGIDREELARRLAAALPGPE